MKGKGHKERKRKGEVVHERTKKGSRTPNEDEGGIGEQYEKTKEEPRTQKNDTREGVCYG